MSTDFAEFTIPHYRRMLQVAASNYTFIGFDDDKRGERGILWRHDIDCSVHRALRLAEIESELGIRSTYFVQTGSMFYNALETEVRRRLHGIVSLGHDIGLHFDAQVYQDGNRLTDRSHTRFCCFDGFTNPRQRLPLRGHLSRSAMKTFVAPPLQYSALCRRRYGINSGSL